MEHEQPAGRRQTRERQRFNRVMELACSGSESARLRISAALDRHWKTMAEATGEAVEERAFSEPPGTVLGRIATEVLLGLDGARARLADKATAAEIEKALAALPAGDPVAAHFRRVRDFAQSRA